MGPLVALGYIRSHTRRLERRQGALHGESPRTKEGRRPNRPKCSGQGLVARGSGTAGAGHGSVSARGIGICAPPLGFSPRSGGFPRFDECAAIDYDSGVARCIAPEHDAGALPEAARISMIESETDSQREIERCH